MISFVCQLLNAKKNICSRTPAGANLIVTQNFAESFPFYEWPNNETLSPENTIVHLRCMVQNCENGPRLVVGVRHECSFEATHCLKSMNQTSREGIMIINEAITLSWMMNSNCSQSLPVPVWCEIGGRESDKGYVHINYHEQRTTAASENISTQTVMLPSTSACSDYLNSNSSKLTNIDVYLTVVGCIITILMNR